MLSIRHSHTHTHAFTEPHNFDPVSLLWTFWPWMLFADHLNCSVSFLWVCHLKPPMDLSASLNKPAFASHLNCLHDTLIITWLKKNHFTILKWKYFSRKPCITLLLFIFMPIMPCYDFYIKLFHWSAGLVGSPPKLNDASLVTFLTLSSTGIMLHNLLCAMQ